MYFCLGVNKVLVLVLVLVLTLMYHVCYEVSLWDACYPMNIFHFCYFCVLSLRLHVGPTRLQAVYMYVTTSSG